MNDPIPIPLDFRDNALRPLRELAERYGVDRHTAAKWRRLCGVTDFPRRPSWSKTEDDYLRANFHDHGPTVIGKELGRSSNAVKARARKLGLGSMRPRGVPQLATSRLSGERTYGRADAAAQHLQHYASVYRCDVEGHADHKGGFWRYGNIILTEPELLAKAERKGWRADSWREIA